MKQGLILVMAVFFLACSKENQHTEMAERYFEIYSKRNELDKMLSFYADEFDYENIGFETMTNDPKFLFENIYGWKDPAFRYESENSIEIEELVTAKNSIVAKGKTKNYIYNGKEVEGTRFVIWLDLDENSKIIQQTDWFAYPMEEILEAYQLKTSMQIK